jgi:NAD(P)-dependent dehydrogenase (short-subunit alcohol dehydrogenase family)
LVTGSGRNIGRAIVLELAGHGANVIVNARSDKAQADVVGKEAEGLGARSLVVMVDPGPPLGRQRRPAHPDQVSGLGAGPVRHHRQRLLSRLHSDHPRHGHTPEVTPERTKEFLPVIHVNGGQWIFG